MPEPERFLAWEDGTIRAQKILSDQRHQPPGNVPFLWCHDLHGAAVEGLAFDRSALEHGALLGPEPIKPGGEQRLDGGRHRQVAADRLADQSERLFDEQRVARRSRLYTFLQLRVHTDTGRPEVGDKRGGVGGPEWLQQHGGGVRLSRAPARL